MINSKQINSKQINGKQINSKQINGKQIDFNICRSKFLCINNFRKYKISLIVFIDQDKKQKCLFLAISDKFSLNTHRLKSLCNRRSHVSSDDNHKAKHVAFRTCNHTAFAFCDHDDHGWIDSCLNTSITRSLLLLDQLKSQFTAP